MKMQREVTAEHTKATGMEEETQKAGRGHVINGLETLPRSLITSGS